MCLGFFKEQAVRTEQEWRIYRLGYPCFGDYKLRDGQYRSGGFLISKKKTKRGIESEGDPGKD